MLTTKYNYFPVRPRHWQTYGGFASVPVIINMPTAARERFLSMLDLLTFKKKLREQKYSYSFSLVLVKG